MSTKNDELEWHIKMTKALSIIEKNQADMAKALSDTNLSDKKIKWYEVSLIFVLVGLVIAFTKLFL